MSVFKAFRRRPAIGDAKALADFVDENSAFLVQKALYEYSRARAGPFSKILFTETAFKTAMEISRWRAYPLGLAMVAEVVDGVLRPHDRANKRREFDALVALVLSVFDRYPIPVALGEAAWRDLRAELVRQLASIDLHAVKRVLDIPRPFVDCYFGLMPIHEKLRSMDLGTTHNYLKLTLCNIHADLTKRIDQPAVVQSITAISAVAPNPASLSTTAP